MATNSQEDKQRVYIDAMIPSYLVAPLSRDPKIAEWQRITRRLIKQGVKYVDFSPYRKKRQEKPKS